MKSSNWVDRQSLLDSLFARKSLPVYWDTKYSLKEQVKVSVLHLHFRIYSDFLEKTWLAHFRGLIANKALLGQVQSDDFFTSVEHHAPHIHRFNC